jgi:hypothetical protein
VKQVPLTKGKFALVDDEDFERVSKLKWRYIRQKHRGYAVRTVKIGDEEYTLPMHRFILPHDLPHTDHRDQNGLNNQKHNLRPATRSQNGQNRRNQKHSSPFKGVFWSKSADKFQASISVNKRKIHLGYFTNAREGALVYDSAAREHFGEFARPNFTEEVSLGV